MIVTAFANGDRASLKPLLSDEVFHAFDQSITTRESAKETTQFTFVGFKDAKIVDAALNARAAEVTVAFGAQFISAVLSAQGAVVEGDAHHGARRDRCVDLLPRHPRARSQLDAGRDVGRDCLRASTSLLPSKEKLSSPGLSGRSMFPSVKLGRPDASRRAMTVGI